MRFCSIFARRDSSEMCNSKIQLRGWKNFFICAKYWRSKLFDEYPQEINRYSNSKRRRKRKTEISNITLKLTQIIRYIKRNKQNGQPYQRIKLYLIGEFLHGKRSAILVSSEDYIQIRAAKIHRESQPTNKSCIIQYWATSQKQKIRPTDIKYHDFARANRTVDRIKSSINVGKPETWAYH